MLRLHVMGAWAACEHALIRAWTHAGLKAARARGEKGRQASNVHASAGATDRACHGPPGDSSAGDSSPPEGLGHDPEKPRSDASGGLKRRIVSPVPRSASRLKPSENSQAIAGSTVLDPPAGDTNAVEHPGGMGVPAPDVSAHLKGHDDALARVQPPEHIPNTLHPAVFGSQPLRPEARFRGLHDAHRWVPVDALDVAGRGPRVDREEPVGLGKPHRRRHRRAVWPIGFKAQLPPVGEWVSWIVGHTIVLFGYGTFPHASGQGTRQRPMREALARCPHHRRHDHGTDLCCVYPHLAIDGRLSAVYTW
jgi:hypothetical protein